MHSYILAGIRMGPLMNLLRRHGFTPSPKNLIRFLFLFQNGLWASLLSWREKKRFGKKIRSFKIPDDPVIIIGHWRTGSTFLHQLLSLDDRWIAPTVFQASFPDSFLVSAPYFRPVMGTLIHKRPQDNVKMGFDDPQEDEFALVKLTLDSPLLDIIFPENPGYFMNHLPDFTPKKGNVENWKKQLQDFCAKVGQDSGKTILLKNPAHSLRIALLREAFPNARFIYIHRHPYKVIASSLHLWKVLARDNQLKGKPYYPGLKEVTEGLIKFYSVIERDLAMLPPGSFIKVCYEDVESDPIKEIKEIYKALNLEFTSDFENSIRSYLDKERGFKKNSYTFDDEQKAQVYNLMKEQFDQYHYKL
jgi:omega-hydroxy-beta-dihydromenaquinone-9 sulfotransferase